MPCRSCPTRALSKNIPRPKPLVSGEECFWKVRVWDKNGKASGWSKPGTWSIGLLSSNDWHGQWIGYDKMRHPQTVKAPFSNGAKWIWFSGDPFPDFPK